MITSEFFFFKQENIAPFDNSSMCPNPLQPQSPPGECSVLYHTRTVGIIEISH